MDLETLQAICLVWLTLVLLKMDGVSPVTISVETLVVVRLPSQAARLPCSFEMQNKSSLFKIQWHSRKNGEGLVVNRESTGTVYTGKYFKNKANLGEGCSLILGRPILENSGGYGVKVFVAHEGFAKAVVELNVQPPIIRTDFDASLKPTTKSPNADGAMEPSQAKANEDSGNPVQLVMSILGVAAVAFLLCGVAVLIYRHCARRGRKQHGTQASQTKICTDEEDVQGRMLTVLKHNRCIQGNLDYIPREEIIEAEVTLRLET